MMCDQSSYRTPDAYEIMVKAVRARIDANPATDDREVWGYRNACFDILEELAAIRSINGNTDD